MRVVRGLKWAKECNVGPGFPEVRLTGSKAAGVAYEKRVAKDIKRRFGKDWEIKISQWIRYEDSAGLGWARPDLYMIRDDLLVIVESKLTQTISAEKQLLKLYLPLLLRIYSRKIVCVQSCRSLRNEPEQEIKLLEDIILEPRLGMWVWFNRV